MLLLVIKLNGFCNDLLKAQTVNLHIFLQYKMMLVNKLNVFLTF